MLNLILKGQSTIMTNIFHGSIFFHFYISICSSLPVYYVLVVLFLLQNGNSVGYCIKHLFSAQVANILIHCPVTTVNSPRERGGQCV